MEKKLQVTSYELQVEVGNANYANFRECVSLGFAEFAEFAVEKRRRGTRMTQFFFNGGIIFLIYLCKSFKFTGCEKQNELKEGHFYIK